MKPSPHALRSQWSRRAHAVPDFLLLGPPKTATTSIFDALVAHADVIGPVRKEVHYFDTRNFERGPGWYRAHFPHRGRLWSHRLRTGRRPRTGEASPTYFADPNAVERVHDLMPRARLIVSLRDPVERAYSHWQHRTRGGDEDRPFARAVSDELDRGIEAVVDAIRADPHYRDPQVRQLRQRAYVTKSAYSLHLERWLARFDRTRLCVVFAEELATAPRAVHDRLLDHLGLEHRSLDSKLRNRSPTRQPIDPAIASELRAVFEPFDARLAAITGRRLPWRSASAHDRDDAPPDPRENGPVAPEH